MTEEEAREFIKDFTYEEKLKLYEMILYLKRNRKPAESNNSPDHECTE